VAITARTSTVVENASTTSITATLPTDRQYGDVIIAVFLSTATSGQFTGPSGWTQVVAPQYGAAMGIGIYYFVHTEATPATAPVGTQTTAGRMSALCQAWSGVNASTPIDMTPTTASTTATSITIPSVTTTVDDVLVLSAIVIDSSSATSTVPSGMTMVADASGGSVGRGGSLASVSQATAGASGSKTWTVSTSIGLVGVNWGLRPGGGAISTIGSVTAAGALAKATTKRYSGAVTAVGALSYLKVVLKVFTASVTAVGALRRTTLKAFTASMTAVGAFRKTLARRFTGSIAAIGYERNGFVRLYKGTITAASNLHLVNLGRIAGKAGIAAVRLARTGIAYVRIRRN
jgi:hypothetical protein